MIQVMILCTVVVSLLIHTSLLMAVDDDTYRNLLDIGDFQDLDFEDMVEEECSSKNTDSLSGELCVPTDPIEDLEWFPSFQDDLISLNNVGLVQAAPSHDDKQTYVDFPVTPEQREKSITKQNPKKKMGEDAIEHGSTWKRARMKNYFKRREGVTWMKKKCTHCETDETPQWRNGPSGPKTLCNACGVRFKSGRLVPEYRPASSPTFDSTKHSNFHRKILKKQSLN